MRKLALVSLLVLLAHPARAAITQNDWGNNSTCGTVTTCSLVNIALNVNDWVFVNVSVAAANWHLTDVTDHQGRHLTFLAAQNSGTTSRVEVWAIQMAQACTNGGAAPTCNFTVTLDQIPAFSEFVHIGADSFTGVTSVGCTTTSSGNSAGPSISLITKDANNWVTGFTSGGSTTSGFTATSGTERFSDSEEEVMDNSAVGAGSTVTLSSTMTPGTDVWAAVITELRTSASGCPTAGANRTLLGVGQ